MYHPQSSLGPCFLSFFFFLSVESSDAQRCTWRSPRTVLFLPTSACVSNGFWQRACNVVLLEIFWWRNGSRGFRCLTITIIIAPTFFINLCWDIVASRCSASFCCAARWVSHMSTHSVPFWLPFPFRSLESIQQSPLRYTVGAHFLPTSHRVSIVYVSVRILQILPTCTPHVAVHTHALYVCITPACCLNIVPTGNDPCCPIEILALNHLLVSKGPALPGVSLLACHFSAF